MPTDDVSLFRAVFTGTSDAVVALDRNHTIVRVNPRLCDMLSIAPHDLIGRSMDELLAARSPGRPAASTGNQGDPFVLRLRRSDGSIVDVEVVTATVEGANNAPTGFLMLMRDATERLRNERLQAILLEVATASEADLNHALESALAMAVELSAADGATLTALDGTVMAGVGRAGEGTPVACVVAGAPVARLTLVGTPAGGSSQDLDLLAHALGQRVASDRTARRLTNAESELRRRNADLEQSNNDLARFSAALSHDLREPLRKVSVLGRLMSDEHGAEMVPEARDLLVRIIGAVDWMGDLLEESLYYSRPTRRLDGLVSLVDSVAAATEALEEAITSSAAEISVTRLPTVRGNSSALTRLFLNLIGNALIHRAGRPARVRISSEAADDGWIVTVEDQGPGIDPRYSDRIFDVFERAAPDGTPGTGLGLAIARKIVLDHGGRIHHDAAYTTGARFVMWLPAVDHHT